MPSQHKRTTTQRGLGYRHRKQRDYLISVHVDGTACWWCGEPMYRDPDRNPDGRPLSADHTVPRSKGGTLADRLLHWQCNTDRGDGDRDDHRPALTGATVTVNHDLGVLQMAWP